MANTVKVYDMTGGSPKLAKVFDKHTSVEYAVGYAYCESIGKLDWFHLELAQGNIMQVIHELPMATNGSLVICGDYVTRKDSNN